MKFFIWLPPSQLTTVSCKYFDWLHKKVTIINCIHENRAFRPTSAKWRTNNLIKITFNCSSKWLLNVLTNQWSKLTKIWFYQNADQDAPSDQSLFFQFSCSHNFMSPMSFPQRFLVTNIRGIQSLFYLNDFKNVHQIVYFYIWIIFDSLLDSECCCLNGRLSGKLPINRYFSSYQFVQFNRGNLRK